jgi:hypothetical protein
MPDSLTITSPAKSCGCRQCELRAHAEENAELRALALNEAEHISRALENLYTDSVPVCGELRYHLLWRLSQLEHIGSVLHRYFVDQVPEDEFSQLRTRIKEMSQRASELEQEVRLLLDAWERPRVKTVRPHSLPTRNRSSSRRSAPSLV